VNWRNLAIGASLTLIVTVIGGILVVLLTRPPAKAERIVYSLDEPVKFEANETKVSLVSAKVANLGNETARNVVVVMEIDDQTSIVEHKLQMSSGSAVEYNDLVVQDKSISVSLQTLVPREVLAISAMLNGIVENQPRLSFRSSSSIGEPGELISDEGEDKWPIIKATLTPLITFVWLASVYWIWVRRRFEIFRGVNNLAFLYMHQGLVKEAEEVLGRYINKRGASAYELLNYGLALAFTEKAEEAQKFFAAGEWLSKSNHVRGLAEFNRSIACVAVKDMARAREHLRRAFELSPKQISRYCEFSVHIKDAIAEDEGTARIVDSHGARTAPRPT
jgi:hypothetical protein